MYIRAHTHTYTNVHTRIYTHIRRYMHVCAYMSHVCVVARPGCVRRPYAPGPVASGGSASGRRARRVAERKFFQNMAFCTV